MKNIFALLVLGMGLFAGFAPAYAQTETPSIGEGDVMAIAENAEERIAGIVPAGVKNFFNKIFADIEAFRLQQVAVASAKRDELAAVVVLEDANRDAAVEENRDEVLEGESTSLYAGAGERLRDDISFGTKAKYYAYKFYTGFVSSPILFYVVGSFLVLYILSSIFRRFRSRNAQ